MAASQGDYDAQRQNGQNDKPNDRKSQKPLRKYLWRFLMLIFSLNHFCLLFSPECFVLWLPALLLPIADRRRGPLWSTLCDCVALSKCGWVNVCPRSSPSQWINLFMTKTWQSWAHFQSERKKNRFKSAQCQSEKARNDDAYPTATGHFSL